MENFCSSLNTSLERLPSQQNHACEKRYTFCLTALLIFISARNKAMSSKQMRLKLNRRTNDQHHNGNNESTANRGETFANGTIVEAPYQCITGRVKKRNGSKLECTRKHRHHHHHENYFIASL